MAKTGPAVCGSLKALPLASEKAPSYSRLAAAGKNAATERFDMTYMQAYSWSANPRAANQCRPISDLLHN
jgi:hypothetical protein